MEFQQVVRKRRMVRAYRQDPLAPEVVQRILANGNRAPSAGFTQGYGFLVLEAAEERVRFWETIAAAGLQPDAQEMAAPLLLVVPLACKMAYLDRYAEPDKGWTDRDEARWPIHTDTSTPASPPCSCCSAHRGRPGVGRAVLPSGSVR